MRTMAAILATTALVVAVSGAAIAHMAGNHAAVSTVHIGIHPGATQVHSHTIFSGHIGVGAHVGSGNWIHPHVVVGHVPHRHFGHFVGRHGHRHGWRFARGWRHHHSHRGYAGYGGGYEGEDYVDTRDGGPPVEYGEGRGHRAAYRAPVVATDPGAGDRYSVWDGYNSHNGVNNAF